MTTTGEVLKPCPFCGGKAETRLVHDGWCVECQSCFVQAAHDLIEDKSIRAWNRRAPKGNAGVGKLLLETALAEQPQPTALQVGHRFTLADIRNAIDLEIISWSSTRYREAATDALNELFDRLSTTPAEPVHARQEVNTDTSRSQIEGISVPTKMVPEGYVLVPVEPTDDMIANMCAAHEFSQFYDLEGPMKDAYKAMIAAAPSNKEVER